jgi:hypothetical protein
MSNVFFCINDDLSENIMPKKPTICFVKTIIFKFVVPCDIHEIIVLIELNIGNISHKIGVCVVNGRN